MTPAEIEAMLDEALNPVEREIASLLRNIERAVGTIDAYARAANGAPGPSPGGSGAGGVSQRPATNELPPRVATEYRALHAWVADGLKRVIALQTPADAPRPADPSEREVNEIIRMLAAAGGAHSGPSPTGTDMPSETAYAAGRRLVLALAGEGRRAPSPAQSSQGSNDNAITRTEEPADRRDTIRTSGERQTNTGTGTGGAMQVQTPQVPPQQGSVMERVKAGFYRGAVVPGAHLVQQTITCGVPTFAREIVAIALTEGLKSHPQVAIALQALLVLPKGYLEKNRRDLLARHPEDSARAAYGLTPDQWDAHDPQDKREMIANMQRHSDGITAMHAVSTLGNLALAAYGMYGVTESRMTSSMLAQEVRNAVYVSRDALQGLAGTTTTHGAPATNRPNMHISSAYYGVMQGIGSVLGGLLVAELATRQGVAVAGTAVMGLQGKTLGIREIGEMAVKVAMVRAGINTLMESIEAYLQNTMQVSQGRDADQVNNRHAVDFAMRSPNDVARVRDHGVARHAWNNVASMIGTVLSLATEPLHRAGVGVNGIYAIDGLGQAAAFAGTYLSVNTTYQAHAEGRKAARRGGAQRAAANQEHDSQEADAV